MSQNNNTPVAASAARTHLAYRTSVGCDTPQTIEEAHALAKEQSLGPKGMRTWAGVCVKVMEIANNGIDIIRTQLAEYRAGELVNDDRICFDTPTTPEPEETPFSRVVTAVRSVVAALPGYTEDEERYPDIFVCRVPTETGMTPLVIEVCEGEHHNGISIYLNQSTEDYVCWLTMDSVTAETKHASWNNYWTDYVDGNGGKEIAQLIAQAIDASHEPEPYVYETPDTASYVSGIWG